MQKLYTVALAVILTGLSFPALAENEFETFEMPANSRAHVDLSVRHQEPNGRPGSTSATGKFVYQQRITPSVAIELRAKGLYDVDDQRYVGSEITVGIRKQLW